MKESPFRFSAKTLATELPQFLSSMCIEGEERRVILIIAVALADILEQIENWLTDIPGRSRMGAEWEAGYLAGIRQAAALLADTQPEGVAGVMDSDELVCG